MFSIVEILGTLKTIQIHLFKAYLPLLFQQSIFNLYFVVGEVFKHV